MHRLTGDLSWLTSELVGAGGQPRRDGVSGPIPGLWFVGLRWLTRRRSAILFGFPDDAATIADAVKLIWMELTRPDSLVDSYHRLITPVRKPVTYTIKLTIKLARFRVGW